ncbi:retrovirus-related pol polyprotein from transposon TNT 1-94, partial [Trifolium medium]|nr:retrovirus-related pol polyprotein from transposon TNT 1-94 [Trifolium medium]
MARSASEYLLRIKSIVNSLITVGDVVSEQEQELANPKVSANVAQVQSNFNDEAMDTETQESGTEHYNVSANRGRGRGKGRGRCRGHAQNAQNSGKVQCQNCGKPNHEALNCWHMYEPQSAKPNSRGYNAPSASRPPLYNPYARPTAQLAIPQYFPSIPDNDFISSASWYPNSGASHHLTFNPNNFAYRAPYQGP